MEFQRKDLCGLRVDSQRHSFANLGFQSNVSHQQQASSRQTSGRLPEHSFSLSAGALCWLLNSEYLLETIAPDLIIFFIYYIGYFDGDIASLPSPAFFYNISHCSTISYYLIFVCVAFPSRFNRVN
jgi:hypothetical protein